LNAKYQPDESFTLIFAVWCIYSVHA